MTQDDVQELLLAINESIARNPTDSSKPLSVSSIAVEKIKELLQAEGKAGWGLRVMVVAGGCAGNTYEMDFEKAPTATDTVVEEGGVKFMISPDCLPKVNGARIDFSDGLKGSGFSIRNPSASSTCGCGTSFA
jgi:iron-sulfur cluster assembly accessory protein